MQLAGIFPWLCCHDANTTLSYLSICTIKRPSPVVRLSWSGLCQVPWSKDQKQTMLSLEKASLAMKKPAGSPWWKRQSQHEGEADLPLIVKRYQTLKIGQGRLKIISSLKSFFVCHDSFPSRLQSVEVNGDWESRTPLSALAR